MTKVGDKFIIEIGEVFQNAPYPADADVLYKVKGFNSLVFDKHGLNKLEPVEDKNNEFQIGDEIIDDEGDLGVIVMVAPTGVMYMDADTCKWYVRYSEIDKICRTGTFYADMAGILNMLARNRKGHKTEESEHE